MERRTFLRTGLTLGAVGLGGGLAALPELVAVPAPGLADDVLRLNSNENPLGLAPAARRAILDRLDEANRYPRDSRVAMIDALAARHGLPARCVVLGNGSTEVLQMAVQALAGPGAPLVLAEPTFEDVPRYAGPYPYRVEPVPLDHRRAHDVGRMADVAGGSSEAVLVYICNPNNPTGSLTPSAEIDDWIGSAPETVYFLVDEAYFEYADSADYWSCDRWLPDRPNVVVVRTFSKIYGMAGMRLGYALAHPDTAARLRRFIGMNNANELALTAGRASLADPELVERSRRANARGAEVLYDCLDELGLEYIPTHTNFVMHRIPGALDAYIRRMREHGVKVGRPFPPMLDYNRVSIGRPEEMERFAEILRGFRNRGWV